MDNGRFSKRYSPHPRRKFLTLAIVLLLLVGLGVGGTLAYFAFSSDPVINTFQAGSVEADIVEGITGNHKNSIQVTNTGKSPVYVRVRLVSYWMDGENIAPVSSETVSVTLNTDNWKQIGEYYYYAAPLASGATTENLLKASITMGTKDGYAQVIEVLADTVQASPARAVEEVWGVEASDFAG